MTGDLHHLAAAYALDAVDEHERRAFEAHYPSCEICVEDLRKFRSVATSLAASASAAPPSGLKAAVMSEISETRQLAPAVRGDKTAGSERRMRFTVLAAAAGLVLVAAVGFGLARITRSSVVDQVLSAPDRVVTTLEGTTSEQTGNVQVIWSDNRDQLVVVGSELAEPGAESVYALWVLHDDGVSPAGLFAPEAGSVSEALRIVDDEAIGWGITIEPVGGSPQPTGAVLFAGTF